MEHKQECRYKKRLWKENFIIGIDLHVIKSSQQIALNVLFTYLIEL